MSIFTVSPVVMLALIASTLILLLLVARWPKTGENILRFCSGLLDLYLRFRLSLQRTPCVFMEKNMAQKAAQSATDQQDRALPIGDPSQMLPVPHPPTATQQPQHSRASGTIGELHS